MKILKWYRVWSIFVIGILGCGNVWGSSRGESIQVAWELWNEPPTASAAPVPSAPKDEPETLDTATQKAAIAKKDALQALRNFEKMRRLAQAAEARRVRMEQASTGNDRAEKSSEVAAARSQEPTTGSVSEEEAARKRVRSVEEQKPKAEAAARPTDALTTPFQEGDSPEKGKISMTQSPTEKAAGEDPVQGLLPRNPVAEEKIKAEMLQGSAPEDLLREEKARQQARILAEQKKAEAEKLREAVARNSQKAEEDPSQELSKQNLAPLTQTVAKVANQPSAAVENQQEIEEPAPVVAEEQESPGAPHNSAADVPAIASAAGPAEVASPVLGLPSPEAAANDADGTDQASEDYVIGPGDILDVSVWKDENLSRAVVVSPDGTFSFPLIGEVQAAGKTVLQLKVDLEKKISFYVSDPIFTLEVKQANSMQIYVIGRVNNPGRFLINSHVNVLQALAMAGGLNPFADEDDIKILREAAHDRTLSYDFNYKKVLRGDNLDQNIRLQRGDVIVVP